MTSETRTYVEIPDLRGLEIECPKCEVRILLPLAADNPPRRLPNHCPNCSEDLIRKDGPEQDQVETLIRILRNLPAESMKAKLRFLVHTPPKTD